jgi:transposase
MDALDEHEMSGCHFILNNAAIYKVFAVQDLIESRRYSPFLNPIELFWSKVKAGVKGDSLTAVDNIIESARQLAFYFRQFGLASTDNILKQEPTNEVLFLD